MKPWIGFSTGALAFGDFRAGLRMLCERQIPAVELSALRDDELGPLVAALGELPLASFKYVSFHAPSKLVNMAEAEVVRLLKVVAASHAWPIIVHPDVITDFSLWRTFREQLCIENMDKRKPIGRSVKELQPIFEQLPEASFCFDIGHARQVDPTMSEAAFLLKAYGHRLKEVHMSEVNSSSKHEAMSVTALSAFREVARLIPPNAPIILESVITEDRIEREIANAEELLRDAAFAA